MPEPVSLVVGLMLGRAAVGAAAQLSDELHEQDKPCPKCYTRRYHHLERIGEKVMCDYCARRYSPPEFEDKK